MPTIPKDPLGLSVICDKAQPKSLSAKDLGYVCDFGIFGFLEIANQSTEKKKRLMQGWLRKRGG